MSHASTATQLAPDESAYWDEKLTVKEVAMELKRHPVTIRNALLDASLHGEQRKTGGHWRITRRCAYAWNRGAKCPHRMSSTVNLSRPARKSA